MTPKTTLARFRFAVGHRRTTVRSRLALLYGVLFLACGAGLLVVTYTLVDHATVTKPQHFVSLPPKLRAQLYGPPPSFVRAASNRSVQITVSPRSWLNSSAGQAVVSFAGARQRVADLHQLEIESVIALAIMALLSGSLGWVVAGRVLRPLRKITTATQQISEANLHERLSIDGPNDELTQLAGTIDDLLQRLETAFDAQRRFVANASHELRTPLAAQRAVLEMVMTDNDVTIERFRDACQEVLEESEHQEQLIASLLALAQGQRGIGQCEQIDLATIAEAALRGSEPGARESALHLHVSLEPAAIAGDPRLLERLATNLVHNAIHHNVPEGEVRVRVSARGDQAILLVANTGAPVPTGEIDRLLQPFQRLRSTQPGYPDGFGLGLSIVAAIATAHGATVDVSPRDGGGLRVEVRFPLARGTERLDGSGRLPVVAAAA